VLKWPDAERILARSGTKKKRHVYSDACYFPDILTLYRWTQSTGFYGNRRQSVVDEFPLLKPPKMLLQTRKQQHRNTNPWTRPWSDGSVAVEGAMLPCQKSGSDLLRDVYSEGLQGNLLRKYKPTRCRLFAWGKDTV
jgi:hypothetical protein